MTATPTPYDPTAMTKIALHLVTLGCALTPVQHGEKRPVRQGWPRPERLVTTPEEAARVWGQPHNVGVVLGPSHLVSVDVDDHRLARDFFADRGLDLDEMIAAAPCRVQGRGWRIYYRQPTDPNRLVDRVEKHAVDGKNAFEIRGGARWQDVMAGLHPTGTQYMPTLPATREEIPILPPEIFAVWEELKAPKIIGKLTPRTPRPREGTQNVIGAYNRKFSVHDMLLRYGYTPAGTNSYLSPHSTTGSPGVRVYTDSDGVQRAVSHHASDPWSDGHGYDAFGIFCVLEHNSSEKMAVRDAARLLGLASPPPPPVADDSNPDDSDGRILGGVYDQSGGYYRDRPIGKKFVPEQLTNWLWTPELRLQYPDGTHGERGTLTVRGHQHHQIEIHATAWNSRRSLLDVIGGYGARCLTTDNATPAKISDFIASTTPDLPVARGVQTYGLHQWGEEWIELYEDGATGNFSHPPIFYAGTPVDPGSPNFAAPRAASQGEIDAARRAILMLPTLVTPSVAWAMLGYGTAAAFAPRVTPHLGGVLPFLYVAGERESGKTSAAQTTLELVTGRATRMRKCPATAYQYDLMFANCNNILAVLDEYRPGEVDDGRLRLHHDLGVHWRGTGRAAVNLAYRLNAPMLVCGEGFTDDAATRSRGILYMTRRSDRGGTAEYAALRGLPLAAYADHLHRAARETPEEEHAVRLEAAEIAAQGALSGNANANPRLKYALQFIAYGLLFLQQDTGGAISDDDIMATLLGGVEQTLEGGQEHMTNLETFLEQVGSALIRVPNPHDYVAPGAEAGTLILRARLCVDLVGREFPKSAAIYNAKLFGQYAKQSDFFADGEKHRAQGGHIVRGWRLRLADVPERCEADSLADLERRLRN